MSFSSIEIAIVGAGLGGLSAAIACSLSGHKVTVFEAASQISEVGAGIQCSPNVVRLFERWGLSKALQTVAVEPRCINFRRWQNGAVIGKTDLTVFKRDFGAPYLVIHRAHLLDILLKRARELGVEVHLMKRVVETDFESERPSVRFADGSSAEADLILGADGIRSATRKAWLQERDPGPTRTRFCVYRATIPAAIMREEADTAALIEAPEINLWVGPDRHVMSYLIAGGGTFNLVLSHPAPDDQDGANIPLDQILNEMRRNYEGWDPTLYRIISWIKETLRWPLFTLQPLPSWVNATGTFALMGDACHGMLPYMSSGAAMAIEDAAALGTLLDQTLRLASPDQPVDAKTRIQRALQNYEIARKSRATEVQLRSILNGKIWHYADGPDQLARDQGMASTLGSGHYIRSTNQWSDPTTQVWLYGHDAEVYAKQLAHTDLRLATCPAERSSHDRHLEVTLDNMYSAGLITTYDSYTT